MTQELRRFLLQASPQAAAGRSSGTLCGAREGPAEAVRARAPCWEKRPVGRKASDGSPAARDSQKAGKRAENEQKRASLQCRSCRDPSPSLAPREQPWPAGLRRRPACGHPHSGLPHPGERIELHAESLIPLTLQLRGNVDNQKFGAHCTSSLDRTQPKFSHLETA